MTTKKKTQRPSLRDSRNAVKQAIADLEGQHAPGPFGDIVEQFQNALAAALAQVDDAMGWD